MKWLKHPAVLLISIVVLFSCQKELSREGGGVPTITDSLKDNCRIRELVEKDAVSGKAEYAYLSTYNSSNLVSRIVLFDSVNNLTDNTFPVTYKTDTIRMDANQYFVLNSDGKVREFRGYDYPNDPASGRITARYSYNGSNQLIQRTQEYDTARGQVAFHVDYTYTANNLTKAVASINNGITFVPAAEVTYEYDAAKTVKNFLYLHALAPEINYFQTAINAGSNSINPIRKATLKYTDATTRLPVTNISNFVNFTIDAKNFVKSFEVTGDDFDVAGLYTGKRYVLNYFCF